MSSFFSSDTSFKILLNASSGHALTWAIFITFVCEIYMPERRKLFVKYHIIITILYTGSIFKF